MSWGVQGAYLSCSWASKEPTVAGESSRDREGLVGHSAREVSRSRRALQATVKATN